jgi:hypothetical protein
MGREGGTAIAPARDPAKAPMKKGRAQSYDRVRDPLNRICPYGEVCIPTPEVVCNKYKSLVKDWTVSQHRTQT